MTRATTILQWCLVIIPILIILTAIGYIAWTLTITDDPTYGLQLDTI